jgi:hypothetical protein
MLAATVIPSSIVFLGLSNDRPRDAAQVDQADDKFDRGDGFIPLAPGVTPRFVGLAAWSRCRSGKRDSCHCGVA